MTPKEYDTAEQSALCDLPNRIIEASRTIAFQAVGYPTHITDSAELWRYADVMQECRLKPTFDALGGLTEHEFRLVKECTAGCYKVSGVVPGSSLIRAIPVYREIKKRYPDGCRVFELGAGSGHLGKLLLLDDFDYHTSDSAQAFALWQMAYLGTKFVIPWWEWMTTPMPRADIVTANHMLNELHPHALVYLAKKIKEIGNPPLLVEDFGSVVIRSAEDTKAILRKLGIFPTLVPWGGDHPVKWDDIVKWWTDGWDGIPETADEKFIKSLQ